VTFDKPEHKEIIKQLIQQASFPGHLLELAAEVKQSVDSAGIKSAADISVSSE